MLEYAVHLEPCDAFKQHNTMNVDNNYIVNTILRLGPCTCEHPKPPSPSPPPCAHQWSKSPI